MKHIFLTSALAISMIVPSFAETTAPDIAAGAESASCDSGTLNTTDGTSTLSAQWTANEINLKWYNGETEFATNTCTYDGGITLPSNEPTRTGYNFAGWQVKQALFDLSTLANKIDIDGYILAFRNANSDWCVHANDNTGDVVESDTCTESIFADYNANEWRAGFEYGTVKGKAVCANNAGEWATAGTPEGTGGQYCWCQASGYDAGNSGSFANVSSPSWVFSYDVGSADSCAYRCAYDCAGRVRNGSDFRSAVFGVSNN
nr:InlB B-repeat-containing protein [Candidatus Enterousia merdequi]